MNRHTDKNEKYYNSYRGRKRSIVAVIALVIIAVMLIWTVGGSLIGIYGAEVHAASVSRNEMRGVWVSTMVNLDYPPKPTSSAATLKIEADNIIKDAKDMGMNAIFLQVRPSADAIYPTSYYPWSKYLTGQQGTAPSDGFDPLEYWVNAAHSAGIELHAWINPYRVTRSGDADLAGLAPANPAKGVLSAYVVKNGKDYYFDPGEPAVRQYIVDSSAEIVRNYQVDGIHLDDYFYPGTDFNDKASFAKYGAGYNSIADWRRNNVNQLISQMDTVLHDINRNISFGVSPSGIWANKSTTPQGSNTKGKEHYSSLYADSVTWIKNGWVDYIAPQIYWNVGFKVADYQVLAEWWNNIVSGTDVALYIGMADYRAVGVKDSSSVWYGTKELLRQLKINRSLSNVKGEIHFRHRLMAGDSGIVNLYKNYYGSSNSGVVPNPDKNKNPGIINDNDNSTDNKTPSPNNLYSDISGNWAEKYINELSKEGIITGMGDGTFRPDDSVTRAQFVKLTAGIASGGVIDDTKSAGFKDVSRGAWYEVYVNWAANKGIVSGMEDNTFRPDDKITREQMAIIIQNLAKSSGIDLKPVRDSMIFRDRAKISDWASDAVNKSVEAGILNGMTEEGRNGAILRYFRPKGETTRAQAAKVISILKAKIENKA